MSPALPQLLHHPRGVQANLSGDRPALRPVSECVCLSVCVYARVFVFVCVCFALYCVFFVRCRETLCSVGRRLRADRANSSVCTLTVSLCACVVWRIPVRIPVRVSVSGAIDYRSLSVQSVQCVSRFDCGHPVFFCGLRISCSRPHPQAAPNQSTTQRRRSPFAAAAAVKTCTQSPILSAGAGEQAIERSIQRERVGGNSDPRKAHARSPKPDRKCGKSTWRYVYERHSHLCTTCTFTCIHTHTLNWRTGALGHSGGARCCVLWWHRCRSARMRLLKVNRPRSAAAAIAICVYIFHRSRSRST